MHVTPRLHRAPSTVSGCAARDGRDVAEDVDPCAHGCLLGPQTFKNDSDIDQCADGLLLMLQRQDSTGCGIRLHTVRNQHDLRPPGHPLFWRCTHHPRKRTLSPVSLCGRADSRLSVAGCGPADMIASHPLLCDSDSIDAPGQNFRQDKQIPGLVIETHMTPCQAAPGPAGSSVIRRTCWNKRGRQPLSRPRPLRHHQNARQLAST